MMYLSKIFILLAFLGPGLSPAAAQTATPEAKQEQIAAERKAAVEAAEKVAQSGPAEIKLIDQATLVLPKGFQFVPQPEAGRFLRANGGSASQSTLGLIFPEGDGNWLTLLQYIPAGYVKDEDAKNWKADELLTSLQEGTEAGNEDRIARGFEPLEVTGWIEKPAYFEQSRQLIWSALVRRKGQDDKDGSVNYNTYALGRDGYFSLDLVTSQSAIAGDKGNARTLLAAIEYLPGKAYSDFNASTDHIAEYGLAALIGGVAAKKLGLLALGAVFFLKFAKIIGLAVIGVGAAFARFFKRKKPEA